MKKISVKGHGLSAVCRLCLSKGVTLLDIFYFSAEMRNKLSNIIMWCAPVQIRRHDAMPNFICRLCYTQLEEFHQFRSKIVQSDKTLRRYLQQLHVSDKQIKSECAIQKSSEENLIYKTNHCDVTVKSESTVFRDIFGTTLNWKEMAPINYNSSNKINEEMSLKFEIKDEPTTDHSLSLTECADDTGDIISKSDASEIVCEDSKVNISYDTKLSEKMCIIGKDGNFKSANNIHQEIPLKFEINDDPPYDNSLNITECTDDTMKTSSKRDGIEICSENSKIDNDHLSENNVAECRGQSEEEKKNISVNYEKLKKATKKKYHCKICNKRMFTSSNLKIHMRIHTDEKPYQCDVCKKCFKHLNSLNIHKRTHSGQKPYQCGVCNKCFSQLGNLNFHKHTHTGEKPYQCSVCTKCFNQLSNLNTHKRTHTDEKPYQCDVCKKCFKHLNSLNIHKRTHTGEKPYHCGVCNKCFSQLGSLNLHKRTHSAEKPYQCSVCNKCFNQLSSLNTHKGTHTDVKPY